jgi:hypothetical protein
MTGSVSVNVNETLSGSGNGNVRRISSTLSPWRTWRRGQAAPKRWARSIERGVPSSIPEDGSLADFCRTDNSKTVGAASNDFVEKERCKWCV